MLRKFHKFMISPWPFVLVLLFIPIATVVSRQLFPTAPDDPKTIVEGVLVAVAQERSKFAEGRVCGGSNLSSWVTTHQIKDFRVVEVDRQTKMNGEWVIPVVSEITGKDDKKRKVTFFLSSPELNTLCVLYVKDEG